MGEFSGFLLNLLLGGWFDPPSGGRVPGSIHYKSLEVPCLCPFLSVLSSWSVELVLLCVQVF